MDPDEYETLTELRQIDCPAFSPLSVNVDFNMLVREHGEDDAFDMLTKLDDLFGRRET